MKTISIKTKDGFQMQSFSNTEYVKYFKDRINEKGQLPDEVVLFKDMELQVKEDKIEFMLSDMGLDRDNERIDPKGWDLENFKGNPIILWSHDKFSPAIGIMENVRVEKGALVGEAKFVGKEIDEFGWSIGERVRQGFLKKGSVGFIPKLMEISNDEQDEDFGVLIHKEQELLEYSIVNVPALPTSGVKQDPMERFYQETGVAMMDHIDSELMAVDLDEIPKEEYNVNNLDSLFSTTKSEYVDMLFKETDNTSGDENFGELFNKNKEKK